MSKVIKGFYLIIIILIVCFVAWQLYIYRTTEPIACGGDWSYMVKCPTGTYCKSEGSGPFVGGSCAAYLAFMFDKIF